VAEEGRCVDASPEKKGGKNLGVHDAMTEKETGRKWVLTNYGKAGQRTVGGRGAFCARKARRCREELITETKVKP